MATDTERQRTAGFPVRELERPAPFSEDEIAALIARTPRPVEPEVERRARLERALGLGGVESTLHLLLDPVQVDIARRNRAERR